MDHATLRVAPDSTYKIYDALFGLEEGVKAYSGENLFHDNRIWINYIFCYFIQAPHFFSVQLHRIWYFYAMNAAFTWHFHASMLHLDQSSLEHLPLFSCRINWGIVG